MDIEEIRKIIEKNFADRISVIKSRYDLTSGNIHKKTNECLIRINDLVLTRDKILFDLGVL